MLILEAFLGQYIYGITRLTDKIRSKYRFEIMQIYTELIIYFLKAFLHNIIYANTF